MSCSETHRNQRSSLLINVNYKRYCCHVPRFFYFCKSLPRKSVISPLSVAIQVPALHVNLFKRRLPGDARGNLFTIMGADITLKQTFDGYTNDLEFNRIKGSLNEVYMHPRTIGKRHLHDLPGSDVNESHYFGRIDIPATVKDKNGNVYMVTALGTPEKGVMYMATKLERISIPGTVKTIGSSSFAGCIRLAIVGLAEGVEEIQKDAFWYCKLLRLNLPDSVRSINKAFPNCSILEHIEIGTGMREMKGAFRKCPSIKTVICNAQNPPEIDEKSFDDDIYRHADLFVPYSAFNKYKNHPLWGKFKNIHEIADTVPSDVQHYRTTHPMKDGIRYFLDLSNTEAWVCPLEGSEIYQQKEVVIPDKFENNFPVVCIDECAFCSSAVTRIKLPSGLKSIKKQAFNDTQLTSISLPATLSELGVWAFRSCPLKEIDIPGSVTTIGGHAFECCGKLERVTLHDGLRKIDECAFNDTHALRELTLPSTVTELGFHAFTGTELKSVTCMALTPPRTVSNEAFDADVLQNAVLKVPSSALAAYQADPAWGKFRQIFSMGSAQSSTSGANTGDTFVENYIRYEIVDANAKVVHVARIRENYKDWFEHCEHDYGVADLVIPSTVNYQGQEYVVQGINDEAVMDNGHSIGVLEIPGTVKSIGKRAFFKCNNIKGLILHDGLETVGDSCFEGSGYYNNQFQLTLPNTVQEIGCRAFCDCAIKDELKIPDSVTYIGESAFVDTCLSILTMGRGLTKIEKRVFYDSSKLKELFIPDWITNIGEGAFFEDEDVLERITCMAMTPPIIEMNTFCEDSYSHVELRVPASAVNDYRDDLVWGKFANIVGIGNATPSEPKPIVTGDYFNVDGVRYWVRDAAARVVYVAQPDHGRKYIGDFFIPPTVEYRGVTYWVKKVGEKAFKGCEKLYIQLPVTIDEIMEDALNIEHMTLICYAKTPPTVAEHGLPEKAWRKTLYLSVPEASLDLYKADPNWKGYGQYGTISDREMAKAESAIPEGMPEPPQLVNTGDNIEVDGIRYWIKDADARVAYVTNFPKDNNYTGNVVVPSTVEKDGVTYQVKKVGNNTFMNAASLEAVTLPASIEDVKTKSFEGCASLNSITCLAVTPPLLAADAIPEDVARHVTLLVPKESYDKYAEAPGWKEFRVRGGMFPL